MINPKKFIFTNNFEIGSIAYIAYFDTFPLVCGNICARSNIVRVYRIMIWLYCKILFSKLIFNNYYFYFFLLMVFPTIFHITWLPSVSELHLPVFLRSLTHSHSLFSLKYPFCSH